MTATNEIWILGANGRCGRAVASELATRQRRLVLVGRDAGRLRDAANAIRGSARVDALPDGSTMVTAAMPTSDLEAARRASGASSVSRSVALHEYV